MSEGKKTTQEPQIAAPVKHDTSDYIKMGITIFITFASCILFFFILFRFDTIVSIWRKLLNSGESIIVGLVLAYLLNPIMHFFERNMLKFLEKKVKEEKKRKKIARGVGVIGSVCVLIIFLALMIAAIVPSLISSVKGLAETLPGSVEKFLKMLKELKFGNAQVTEYLSLMIQNATDYIEDLTTTKILPQAQTYLTHITSGVISAVKSFINFIIGIIVAVYVMSIQETLAGQCKKAVYAVCKPRKGNLFIEIVRETHKIFGGFITGKLLDSLIIGVICYFGCLILKIPNTILIAVVIGVTNVIPFFGPIIGAIPCLFLVVVQSPIHALYLLIFIVVLQQVDGNIIGPKILGDSIGLSSFWVMFAILVGGGMFGFLGMLLGVPVMGVLQYIARRLINYKLRKRKLSENTQDYIKVQAVDEKTNRMVYEDFDI